MKSFAKLIIFFGFFALMLTACESKSVDPAAQAVVNYLNALVNKDSAKLSTLSCASWEASAQLEFDSLQAVKARLEGLKCKVVETVGSTTQVNCQGKILATYNNEEQEIDLSVRNYQVVQQGGEFLVCGYQ